MFFNIALFSVKERKQAKNLVKSRLFRLDFFFFISQRLLFFLIINFRHHFCRIYLSQLKYLIFEVINIRIIYGFLVTNYFYAIYFFCLVKIVKLQIIIDFKAIQKAIYCFAYFKAFKYICSWNIA